MFKVKLFSSFLVLGSFVSLSAEAAYFPVNLRYPSNFDCKAVPEAGKFRAKGSVDIKSYAVYAYPYVDFVIAVPLDGSAVPYVIESGKYFRTEALAKRFCINLRSHMGHMIVWPGGGWKAQHTHSTYKTVLRNGEYVRLLRTVRRDVVSFDVSQMGVFTGFTVQNGGVFTANNLRKP